MSAVDVFSNVIGTPTWTLGDGSAAAGTTVQKTYATPGSFPVSVSQPMRSVIRPPPRRVRQVLTPLGMPFGLLLEVMRTG